MITHAFIELEGPNRPEKDAAVAAAGLENLRIPWDGFYAKRAARGQVPFAHDALVAGTIPSIRHAFNALRCEFPSTDDYPTVLRGMLRRKVWRSDWQTAQNSLDPVFVKPFYRLKDFTGFVVGEPTLARIKPRDPVWCSEVVQFKSEYRAFCVLGEVLAVRHYHGDQTPIDLDMVAWAAAEYYRAGGPTAFLLDVGALSIGETALVEANDAFSCGGYGVSASAYIATLGTRWIELVQSRTAAVRWARQLPRFSQ